MDFALGTAGSQEPPEVRRLRTRSEKVVAMVAALAAEHQGSRIRRLVGLPALVTELRRLEPKAQRFALVMQPQYAYYPEEPGVLLTQHARDRGVETRLLTRPSTVLTHPLLPSIFPDAMLGPVFLRAMVVDGEEVLLGGPDDAWGRRTSWSTSIPAVVQAVMHLWEATLPLSEPILPPGTPPPLTPRQLEVARLLCVGEKDRAIARLLDLSPRTVEREVSALLRELGAGSRTEAVLLMCGRGLNGGQAGRRPSP
jgi:DNA-binding CsgD family transcriptional regulator